MPRHRRRKNFSQAPPNATQPFGRPYLIDDSYVPGQVLAVDGGVTLAK